MPNRIRKIGSNGRQNACHLFIRTRPHLRNEKGWSLAATLLMMIVITLFVAAMWSSLLPAYLNVASLRYKDVARSLDESAVDGLLQQINTQMAVPPAQVGNTTNFSTTRTVSNATFSINTNITNLGPMAPTNSVLCPFNNQPRPAGDNFHLIQSQVVNGLMKKTVSVLLFPIEKSPAASGVNPWKNGPAMAVGPVGSTVNEIGLACVNGYNLPAGWNNPYQFADTTVASGVTWQVGSLGNNARSQIIAGNQYEYWQPGQQPAPPSGTYSLTYEPFTQIMGNVYSNYTAQNGANGNGYWARNQLSDYNGGSNVPGGSPDNANVFGAQNGMTLNGAGVPTGYESGSSGKSIPIPPPTNGSSYGSTPTNGSAASASTGMDKLWGYNTNPFGTTGVGNYPNMAYPDGGKTFQSNPYTGGYITAPGPGQAGALDNWVYPPPPTYDAPGAPSGVPQPATGGLGVPDNHGTYFSSAPQAVTVNGGTLNITSTATAPPPNLSVGPGKTVNIPPGNYSMTSLQVINGGKITVDPSVQGQTQIFLNPAGNGQGTNGALYVDNSSSINTLSAGGSSQISGTGFTSGGTKGYGKNLPQEQPAVDVAHPIQESQGSCLNLTFNTNASCNMLFAGQSRALVNAPYANINVGYQPNPDNVNNYNPNSQNAPNAVMSKDANFYGAIIAGNVSVVSDYSSGAGAYLHYDVNLKRMNNYGSGKPVSFSAPLSWYDPLQWKGQAPAPPPPSQWRAVSWLEQNQ
jgi:hypothetical protein